MVTTKTIRDIHVKVPTLLFGMASYTYTVKCYKVRLLETLRQKQTQALVNKLYCMLLPCVCVCVCLSVINLYNRNELLYSKDTQSRMCVWENGFLGAKNMGGKFFGMLGWIFWLHTHTQLYGP